MHYTSAYRHTDLVCRYDFLEISGAANIHRRLRQIGKGISVIGEVAVKHQPSFDFGLR